MSFQTAALSKRSITQRAVEIRDLQMHGSMVSLEIAGSESLATDRTVFCDN